MVLVLTAYDPAKWTVTIEPGAKVERIIVSGCHRQILEGVPADVPTQIASGDDMQPYFYLYSLKERESGQSIAKLRKATGMEISTFQGSESYTPQELTIGPENSGWQMQRVAKRLGALAAEVAARQRATVLDKLADLRFEASYRGDGGPADRRAGEGMRATYTLRGPIAETIRRVPVDANGTFYDPTDETWYTWQQDAFSKKAPGGAIEPIPFDSALPRLSWPRGIAFDSKRRRLLLNSFGGGGHLYAYDIAKETWSLLRTPGLGIIAMSYSPELDVLYVYHAENGDRVSTYTPHGVRIGHIKLERGLAGGGMSGAFEDNTYIRPVGLTSR
jgi:hypothetical protein